MFPGSVCSNDLLRLVLCVRQTSLLYSLCGCALFCGFIVYDTQRITTIYGYDDYLLAAIDLYLDIVNLFLYILSLMSRSRND